MNGMSELDGSEGFELIVRRWSGRRVKIIAMISDHEARKFIGNKSQKYLLNILHERDMIYK